LAGFHGRPPAGIYTLARRRNSGGNFQRGKHTISSAEVSRRAFNPEIADREEKKVSIGNYGFNPN
jgi:hypothetical protein